MPPNKAVDTHLLRSIDLFAKLADAHFPPLVAAASLCETPAREILFTERKRVDSLYVLISGKVEFFSEHCERHFTVAVVPAVKVFVLPALLADRNPISARTLEPCELIVLPVGWFLEMMGRDGNFARAVARDLAQTCSSIVEEFKNHRLRRTSERVAHWMLRHDESTGGTGHFVIPYDKRILASYLGITPEHLSRSFAALESAGVTVHGRDITVTDRAALSKAAGLDLSEAAQQVALAAPAE
jgi:CRP/FNR family transcriptional activator FtrB